MSQTQSNAAYGDHIDILTSQRNIAMDALAAAQTQIRALQRSVDALMTVVNDLRAENEGLKGEATPPADGEAAAASP